MVSGVGTRGVVFRNFRLVLVAVGGSLVCVVAKGPSLNVFLLESSSSSIFAA